MPDRSPEEVVELLAGFARWLLAEVGDLDAYRWAREYADQERDLDGVTPPARRFMLRPDGTWRQGIDLTDAVSGTVLVDLDAGRPEARVRLVP